MTNFENSIMQVTLEAEHEERLNQIQELMVRTVLTPVEQEKLSSLVDAASEYEDVFHPIQS